MSQHTAALNLEWRRIFPDEYRAILPAIPGLTTSSDDNSVDIQGISGSWMFTIWLDLVCGFPVCLFNKDFDIPNGSSFEEMKQAVENLSIEDITRKVVEQADKLVDDEFTDEELEAFHQLLNQYATASRHASKRTADLDVDWWKTSADTWAGTLPEIPGFPKPGGGHYHVGLDTIVNDDHEIIGYGFSLNIVGPTGAVTLWNDDFGFGYADSEEEAKQEVESLSPEEIAQAAADKGVQSWADVTASREGKHMIRKATRRTASMNLDWYNPSEDTWQADLPAIPGYTGADGNDSSVTVVYNGETELAVPYDAVCTIFLSQGGVVNLNLWDMWSFDPFGPDAKDVMQAVDDLDVYDISHQLESMGYEPIVNEDGEYVVASRKPRHATHRTAHMDLNWQRQLTGAYMAELPAIPGYPTGGAFPAFSHTVMVLRPDYHEDIWAFQIGLVLLSDTSSEVTLTNEDFGILDGDSADEMMDAVENLDPVMIADALAAKGYMPEEG